MLLKINSHKSRSQDRRTRTIVAASQCKQQEIDAVEPCITGGLVSRDGRLSKGLNIGSPHAFASH